MVVCESEPNLDKRIDLLKIDYDHTAKILESLNSNTLSVRGFAITVTSEAERVNKGLLKLYEEGRKRFLSRAHALSRLAHPSLEPSRAPIEERNTAYAIAEAVDGPTLAAWARNLGRSPTQAEMDALLAPLLDGLAKGDLDLFLWGEL